MPFAGMAFLVPLTVCPSTVAVARRHGGRTVYAFDDGVTCGIQASSAVEERSIEGLQRGGGGAQKMRRISQQMNALDGFPSMDRIRNHRLFIVHECWVLESARRGHCLPLHPWDTQRVAYHPFSVRGLSFTTSQLPRSIKWNVVAALQYCGAHYTTHLDGNTQLVVYSKLLSVRGNAKHQLHLAQECVAEQLNDEAPRANTKMFVEGNCFNGVEVYHSKASEGRSGMSSSKLEAAQAAGIPCVTPSWVELCVRFGQCVSLLPEYSCSSFLLPLFSTSSTTLPKRQREDSLFYVNAISKPKGFVRRRVDY